MSEHAPSPEPHYDPTQAVPGWLPEAPFQLPTARDRTPLENAVFGQMALNPDDVRFELPLHDTDAQHIIRIETEQGRARAAVLSNGDTYRGFVVTGRPVERRLGPKGSIRSLPDGSVMGLRYRGLHARIYVPVALEGGWHDAVPHRFRTANYIARLIESGTSLLGRESGL